MQSHLLLASYSSLRWGVEWGREFKDSLGCIVRCYQKRRKRKTDGSGGRGRKRVRKKEEEREKGREGRRTGKTWWLCPLK